MRSGNIFELLPPFPFLAGTKNNLMWFCIFNLRKGYSGTFLFTLFLFFILVKANEGQIWRQEMSLFKGQVYFCSQNYYDF